MENYFFGATREVLAWHGAVAWSGSDLFPKPLDVLAGLAEGEKCVRCWQVLPEVAESQEHLCRRCTGAVAIARAA